MKTLGLIGGTSWHSTVDYYRLINRGVHERLGEVNAARLVMFSLNMQEFKNIIDAGGWKAGENYLVPFAQKLEAFGAEGLVICANTPHIVADGIRAAVSIPLIHIVEATALVLAQKNVSTVGVLGTTFTMEQPFYRDVLEKHGIKMIVPEPEDRAWINDNIFGELAAGVFRDETKQRTKTSCANSANAVLRVSRSPAQRFLFLSNRKSVRFLRLTPSQSTPTPLLSGCSGKVRVSLPASAGGLNAGVSAPAI